MNPGVADCLDAILGHRGYLSMTVSTSLVNRPSLIIQRVIPILTPKSRGLNQFGDIPEPFDGVEVGEPGNGLPPGFQGAMLDGHQSRSFEGFDAFVDMGNDETDMMDPLLLEGF